MTDKREALLLTAAKLIHEHGYNNVGIKTIVDELEIPKGSFYYYFDSKEKLALEIIDLYINDTKMNTESVEQSIAGIKEFFNIFFNRLEELELMRGCPVGNLILELSDEKECFRLKLMEWYRVLETWIITILSKLDVSNPDEKAKVLIGSFEGAMLVSKLEKSSKHFQLFNKYIVDNVINQK